jgi:hypothetical protein
MKMLDERAPYPALHPNSDYLRMASSAHVSDIATTWVGVKAIVTDWYRASVASYRVTATIRARAGRMKRNALQRAACS